MIRAAALVPPIMPADGWVSEAAERLVGIGAVLVLAGRDVPAELLPPPTARERADAAYLAQERRAGWLLRRQIARAILAHAWHCDAMTIRIGATATGAPTVEAPGYPDCLLSFAARGEIALIGLARARPGVHAIGVDLEQAEAATLLIPWNILAPEERAMLAGLPEDQQWPRFRQLWTLKEATVKALGTGFRLPPEGIGVDHRVDPPRIFRRDAVENRPVSASLVLTWEQQTRFNGDVTIRSRAFAGEIALACVILDGPCPDLEKG